MQWAVFDVDGTLYPVSSMEKRFLFHMLKDGTLPMKNVLRFFLVGVSRMLQINYEEGFNNNKCYLKNLPAEEIRVEAARFFTQEIRPGISSEGLNRIEDCRNHGFKILMMSGSPDFLVGPLNHLIQPDYFVSSELEIEDGLFTGQVTGLHPYGQRKVEILQGLQRRLNIGFEDSIVFANHRSDVQHMLLFKEAVAVNPTRALAKFAKKHQWRIEQWH